MSADNRESTLKNLEQIKKTWQEKLYFLEEQRAIIANANKQFELENRTKKCRKEIEKITKEIEFFKKDSQQKTFILKPVNPAII